MPLDDSSSSTNVGQNDDAVFAQNPALTGTDRAVGEAWLFSGPSG
jgi:hypothetical protein